MSNETRLITQPPSPGQQAVPALRQTPAHFAPPPLTASEREKGRMQIIHRSSGRPLLQSNMRREISRAMR
ncbi:hypothetical protein LZ32DRAFT_602708 [Colletotrichum eremochloae]|nr:hypothetical protein LY78DRAFT_659861 [Colletotrichum sublineola]KAK2015341.1 hypothetical protein LZ32DRAFT_602708 [Colletotrichum eremochloae]